MSKLPGKKKDLSARTPLVPGRVRAAYESIRRKRVDRSDNNSLAIGSRKLKGRKRGVERKLKLALPRPKEISPKSAGARRQNLLRTEYIHSEPEPQTQAKTSTLESSRYRRGASTSRQGR